MPEFLYRIQPTRLTMLTDAPTPAEARPSPPIARTWTVWQRASCPLFGRTQTTDAWTFGIVIFAPSPRRPPGGSWRTTRQSPQA